MKLLANDTLVAQLNPNTNYSVSAVPATRYAVIDEPRESLDFGALEQTNATDKPVS